MTDYSFIDDPSSPCYYVCISNNLDWPVVTDVDH